MPAGRFSTLLIAALYAALLVPAVAGALAGGATGGGGGGGGGFSGGGSGSGSGGELSTTGTVVLLVFVGGTLAAVSAPTYVRVRRRRRRAQRVEREARIADLDDGYWDPQELKARVHETFFPVQGSWGANDAEASRPYVSDALLERHRSQLEGLRAQRRVNRIEDLSLGEIEIVRIHNVADDRADRFVAYVACKARDWMEDTSTGAVVNGNRKSVSAFEQFWTFVRHPAHGWVLDEIQQYKEGEYHLSEPVVNLDGIGSAR